MRIPRFTFVSDGYPRRRLLIGSKALELIVFVFSFHLGLLCWLSVWSEVEDSNLSTSSPPFSVDCLEGSCGNTSLLLWTAGLQHRLWSGQLQLPPDRDATEE